MEQGLAGGQGGELIIHSCEDFLDNSGVTKDRKIHCLVVVLNIVKIHVLN